MKNLIITAALALGLTATSVKAGVLEDCSELSSAVFEIAEARDAGVGPELAFKLLTENGVSLDLVSVLIDTIYVSGSSISAENLKNVVFSGCIKGLT